VIHSRGPAIGPDDLPPEVVAATPVRAPAVQLATPSDGDERTRLLAALHRSGGSRVRAAKLLGVSRATFYRRLRDLGLSHDE
jgi:transcriptional regulator of acetoin/glycerol metabolism